LGHNDVSKEFNVPIFNIEQDALEVKLGALAYRSNTTHWCRNNILMWMPAVMTDAAQIIYPLG
jgi:hypothetical protein